MLNSAFSLSEFGDLVSSALNPNFNDSVLSFTTQPMPHQHPRSHAPDFRPQPRPNFFRRVSALVLRSPSKPSPPPVRPTPPAHAAPVSLYGHAAQPTFVPYLPLADRLEHAAPPSPPSSPLAANAAQRWSVGTVHTDPSPASDDPFAKAAIHVVPSPDRPHGLASTSALPTPPSSRRTSAASTTSSARAAPDLAAFPPVPAVINLAPHARRATPQSDWTLALTLPPPRPRDQVALYHTLVRTASVAFAEDNESPSPPPSPSPVPSVPTVSLPAPSAPLPPATVPLSAPLPSPSAPLPPRPVQRGRPNSPFPLSLAPDPAVLPPGPHSLNARTLGPRRSLPAPSKGRASPRASYISPRLSYASPSTTHASPRTSFLLPTTSCLSPRTSYLSPKTSAASPRTSTASPRTGATPPRPAHTSTIPPAHPRGVNWVDFGDSDDAGDEGDGDDPPARLRDVRSGWLADSDVDAEGEDDEDEDDGDEAAYYSARSSFALGYTSS